MADGNNRSFMRNPMEFMSTHSIIAVNSKYEKSLILQRGLMSMDLVSDNSSGVYLADYTQREHQFGSQPVKAWFLPATLDDKSTLEIDSQADYLFTAALSGCLFAAYGEFGNSITVEHVNDLSRKGESLIEARAQAILAASYPFCKILSPGKGYGDRRVKTYSKPSFVVGVRKKSGGGWQFIYKPSLDTSTEL